jgi:hypothetical protein
VVIANGSYCRYFVQVLEVLSSVDDKQKCQRDSTMVMEERKKKETSGSGKSLSYEDELPSSSVSLLSIF